MILIVDLTSLKLCIDLSSRPRPSRKLEKEVSSEGKTQDSVSLAVVFVFVLQQVEEC